MPMDAVCDPETGLLEKEAFASLASRQIREAEERGKTLKLTMVHTADFDELRARTDAEHAENALRTMGAYLQANAAGGQAAGHLDDGAFRFLHKPGLDVEKIKSRLEEIFVAADPTGKGIALNSGTVEADVGSMSDSDSVRVLLYTVNKFCESSSGGFKSSMKSKAKREKLGLLDCFPKKRMKRFNWLFFSHLLLWTVSFPFIWRQRGTEVVIHYAPACRSCMTRC